MVLISPEFNNKYIEVNLNELPQFKSLFRHQKDVIFKIILGS